MKIKLHGEVDPETTGDSLNQPLLTQKPQGIL